MRRCLDAEFAFCAWCGVVGEIGTDLETLATPHGLVRLHYLCMLEYIASGGSKRPTRPLEGADDTEGLSRAIAATFVDVLYGPL
jgi:hypothetical protein